MCQDRAGIAAKIDDQAIASLEFLNGAIDLLGDIDSGGLA
jgi:hypothetical protein